MLENSILQQSDSRNGPWWQDAFLFRDPPCSCFTYVATTPIDLFTHMVQKPWCKLSYHTYHSFVAKIDLSDESTLRTCCSQVHYYMCYRWFVVFPVTFLLFEFFSQEYSISLSRPLSTSSLSSAAFGSCILSRGLSANSEKVSEIANINPCMGIISQNKVQKKKHVSKWSNDSPKQNCKIYGIFWPTQFCNTQPTPSNSCSSQINMSELWIHTWHAYKYIYIYVTL